jgi:hypothetical protein
MAGLICWASVILPPYHELFSSLVERVAGFPADSPRSEELYHYICVSNTARDLRSPHDCHLPRIMPEGQVGIRIQGCTHKRVGDEVSLEDIHKRGVSEVAPWIMAYH